MFSHWEPPCWRFRKWCRLVASLLGEIGRYVFRRSSRQSGWVRWENVTETWAKHQLIKHQRPAFWGHRWLSVLLPWPFHPGCASNSVSLASRQWRRKETRRDTFFASKCWEHDDESFPANSHTFWDQRHTHPPSLLDVSFLLVSENWSSMSSCDLALQSLALCENEFWRERWPQCSARFAYNTNVRTLEIFSIIANKRSVSTYHLNTAASHRTHIDSRLWVRCAKKTVLLCHSSGFKGGQSLRVLVGFCQNLKTVPLLCPSSVAL